MSGEIPIGGFLEILREIESRRITGRIQFNAGGQSGEVEVIGGQIALDQEPRTDGSDPVEAMLALRAGTFVVHQRLPPLPVSAGDDGHRTGSLAVHVPADLMNYCEQAGLTGTLRLTNDGEVVELVYEAGELLAIRIDEHDNADLSHVFGWTEGRFEIRVGREVRSLVPDRTREEDDVGAREPTTQFVRAKKDDTGKHFLKVLEVALTDIVATREKARPPARTSPPRAPAPSVRPPALPPPKRKREATVRIVYLAGDDESALAAIDHATRYASSANASEEVTVAPAKPTLEPILKAPSIAKESLPRREERRSTPEARSTPEPRRSTPEARKSDPRSSKTPEPPPPAMPRSTFGWWLAVLALVIVLVALLTQLFPPAAQ